MEINNEFRVRAAIDHAWRTLTDLAGIASCLPGAQLTGVDGDTFLGKVKIKVGPVTTEYSGTATFLERDDTNYRARIDARGNESRGAGTASAVITAALRTEGADTVVSVVTTMTITGKVAQFGRGMIEEISARLLQQFAANVEARIRAAEADQPSETVVAGAMAGGAPAIDASGSGPAAPTPVSHDARPAPTGEPEALDLLQVAGGSIARRLVPVVVGLIATIVVVRIAMGRRRNRGQRRA